MSVKNLKLRLGPIALAAALSMASQASAQNLPLFTWVGNVDREVQIVMRGGRVMTREIGMNEPGGEVVRVASAMPRQEGQVAVRVMSGRGDVSVIQQPSLENNF